MNSKNRESIAKMSLKAHEAIELSKILIETNPQSGLITLQENPYQYLVDQVRAVQERKDTLLHMIIEKLEEIRSSLEELE